MRSSRLKSLIKTKEPEPTTLFKALKKFTLPDYTKLPNKHWILATSDETTPMSTEALIKFKKKDVLELLEKRMYKLSANSDFYKGRWNKRDLKRTFRKTPWNKPIVAAILAHRYSDLKSYNYLESERYKTLVCNVRMAEIALAGGFLDDTRNDFLSSLKATDAQYFDKLRITDKTARDFGVYKYAGQMATRAVIHAPLVSDEVKLLLSSYAPSLRDEFHLYKSMTSKSLSDTLLALAKVNGHHAQVSQALKLGLQKIFYQGSA